MKSGFWPVGNTGPRKKRLPNFLLLTVKAGGVEKLHFEGTRGSKSCTLRGLRNFLANGHRAVENGYHRPYGVRMTVRHTIYYSTATPARFDAAVVLMVKLTKSARRSRRPPTIGQALRQAQA